MFAVCFFVHLLTIIILCKQIRVIIQNKVMAEKF